MQPNLLDTSCPYCGEKLIQASLPVGQCEQCQTPHHQECWISNGSRCTVLGCGGNRLIEVFSEDLVWRLLQVALKKDSDTDILEVWRKYSFLLKAHPDISLHRDRLTLAERRVEAIKRLEELLAAKAISIKTDRTIVATWEILSGYLPARRYVDSVTLVQRRLDALHKLEKELKDNDDELIADFWQRNEELLVVYGEKIPDRVRIDKAVKVTTALHGLLSAIDSKNDGLICQEWRRHQAVLEAHPKIQHLRQGIQQAEDRQDALQRLRDAVESKSDEQILNVWRRDSSHLRDYSPAQEYSSRISLAERRTKALLDLRNLVAKSESKEAVNFYTKYQDLLDDSVDFLPTERQSVITLSRQLLDETTIQLRHALALENDEQIDSLYREHSSYTRVVGGSQTLGKEMITRAELASERLIALKQLREVLRGRSERITEHAKVVQIYEKHRHLLLTCRSLTAEERVLIRRAQQQVSLHSLRNAVKREDPTAIVDLGRKAIQAGCRLAPSDYQNIMKIGSASALYKQCQEAIATGDDLLIDYVCNAPDNNKSFHFTNAEKDRIRLAEQRVQRWYLLRHALKLGDNNGIASYFDESLFSGSSLLNAEEIRQCQEMSVKVRMQV